MWYLEQRQTESTVWEGTLATINVFSHTHSLRACTHTPRHLIPLIHKDYFWLTFACFQNSIRVPWTKKSLIKGFLRGVLSASSRALMGKVFLVSDIFWVESWVMPLYGLIWRVKESFQYTNYCLVILLHTSLRQGTENIRGNHCKFFCHLVLN